MKYADFEGILEPIQERVPGDSNEPYAKRGPSRPYTTKVNQHIPSGWCVYSKFAYGEVETPLELYRGKDSVEKFCDYIKEETHRLHHMFLKSLWIL